MTANSGRVQLLIGPLVAAISIVSSGWGDCTAMAKGVERIIRGWNRFFANFDFDGLVNCIENSLENLKDFRNRDISNLSEADNDIIERMFNHFIEALKRKSDGRKSAVSVAKALSVLAPDFFPLWDDKIARAYGCYYGFNPTEKYISFCKIMRWITKEVKDYIESSNKSILKLLDEYNYSKYTNGWI